LKSPYHTLDFLKDAEQLLSSQLQWNVDDNDRAIRQLCNDINVWRQMLQWRVIYLLSESGSKMIRGMANAQEQPSSSSQQQSAAERTAAKQQTFFTVWNDSQVFAMHDVAKAYIELVILQCNLEALQCADKSLKPVLTNLCSIYALNAIQRTMSDYLEGQFITAEHSKLIKHTLLLQCHNLVTDGVSLIDALAPPDSAIWSPFGMSDGNMYEKFYNKITKESEGCYDRVSYWELLRTPLSQQAKGNVNDMKSNL